LGHFFKVDAVMSEDFFQIIRPLVQDQGKLSQLVKGFPSPRAIMGGPWLTAKRPISSSHAPRSSSLKPPLPQLGQRFQVLITFSSAEKPEKKKRHSSPSPTPSSSSTICDLEQRIHRLEGKLSHLTPQLLAAPTEMAGVKDTRQKGRARHSVPGR